ncbi:protein of unknown function [Petrocella atlantisensis]|uniref:Uncharacterized protein n=1 Tax=Petrocella atlantisensis TaxID=2173034 RepID=A0A3P7PW72_9FIRM|nr:protein of unknown function [Petrocella atlantisensis]
MTEYSYDIGEQYAMMLSARKQEIQ